jgi:hypothetical protein
MVLAALVQRGVDVRHATRDARRDRVAHGGDLPADDRVDAARGHQGVDVVGHARRRTGGVDDVQADGAAEQAGPGVDLLGGELGAQLAGRAVDARRAVLRDQERDVQRRVLPVWVAAHVSHPLLPPVAGRDARGA